MLLYLISSFCIAESLAVNDAAPAFTLPLLEGKEKVTLSDYKGRVVYIDFWASWCIPCRRSFPFLNKLQAQYADKGFEVIAINLEQTPEDAKKFLAQFPVSYPVLKGDNSNIGQIYNIFAMPTGYLIGKKGNVRVKNLGFDKAQENYLEAMVDKLVSEF
jgi:thiol-disulfide isomerase/thioredoxin